MKYNNFQEYCSNSNEFYTEEEVAKKLSISLYTIRRWYIWYKYYLEHKNEISVQVPKLPIKVRVGRKKLFLKEDLIKIKEFKKFYSSRRGLMRDINSNKSSKEKGYGKYRKY